MVNTDILPTPKFPSTLLLRIASSPKHIQSLLPFYTIGLGLDVIYSFHDHEGFDGIVLAHPGFPYTFEFTRYPSVYVEEDLAPKMPRNMTVLYFAEKGVWEGAVRRMNRAGFESVRSLHPYWDRKGVTFEDPDGYRVVLLCESEE